MTTLVKQPNGQILLTRTGLPDVYIYPTTFVTGVINNPDKILIRNNNDGWEIYWSDVTLPVTGSRDLLVAELGTNFFFNAGDSTAGQNVTVTNDPLNVEVSTMGVPVSAQYPLATDGDTIYAKDIDVDSSNQYNFVGNILSIVDDLHTELIDSTANATKTLLIHLYRTTTLPLIGLGGSFSNIRVTAILSGNIESIVWDSSTDNTVRTTQFFQFPNTGFNAIKLEFFTVGTITITNLFAPKLRTVTTISETSVKFASSYKSPYLLNGGSELMNVNGSVTPVDFTYTALGLTRVLWRRSFIDLQDGTQEFDPDNFGALAALTNGVQVIVTKNGVETILETWNTNMDISMTMYDFQSPYKLGAYIGRWTIANDIGAPVSLFQDDTVTLRVNDDLTSLEAFRFRLKLSQ